MLPATERVELKVEENVWVVRTAVIVLALCSPTAKKSITLRERRLSPRGAMCLSMMAKEFLLLVPRLSLGCLVLPARADRPCVVVDVQLAHAYLRPISTSRSKALEQSQKEQRLLVVDWAT